MPTYIQNYGFTKTYIKDNNKKVKNELQWIGDYDGNNANVKLDINDNGIKKVVSMQLDNNDLMNILGIQPIQKPLEQRLTNDFLDESYTPITLEGVLTKRKTRKHSRRKHSSRKHSSRKHSSHKYSSRKNKYKRRKTYRV
jgi:hypothetical protein